jgi:ADP-ribosylglycohydrolase
MELLTCADCGRAAEAEEVVLRPDGFVCSLCDEKRLGDPGYVARQEAEVLELVQTVVGAPDDAAQALHVPAPPTGAVGRALDSLVGLAVGDALGATREGWPYDPAAPPLSPPKPGTRVLWTDDTQMALSVVEVLLERDGVDPDHLARAFARRYEPWRGYGTGMHALLRRLRSGGHWETDRFAIFRDGSFGNGSAMRVAPLGAFLAERSRGEIIEQATRSAVVTHAHPEGVAGAVAVALAAGHAARSRGGAPPEAKHLLEGVVAALSGASDVARGVEEAIALPSDTSLGSAVERLGNGSRVSCRDTVPLALWIVASRMDDYRGAVETAVSAGGDTDTMAAIVGGVVAARVGVSGIPPEWREAVEPLPLETPTPR